jgi:uncharacterized membrane protein YozB (DUF420 family)
MDKAPVVESNPQTPLVPRSTLLLCLPCWAMAAYCAILIAVTKLAPHSARSLVSASVLAVPLFLTVISPFCWIGSLIATFRLQKRKGRIRAAAWIFLALSAVVFLCTWMALEHFNRR